MDQKLVVRQGVNVNSLVYLLLIPVVIGGYLQIAAWSMAKKDKTYAIPTYNSTAAAPTGTRGAGYIIKPSSTPKRVNNEAVNMGVTSVPVPVENTTIIIVVTATPSPVPTLTPNPYGTLHVTMTELWRLAYTATPYAATLMRQPLFYMNNNQCFANCGFVTATMKPN